MAEIPVSEQSAQRQAKVDGLRAAGVNPYPNGIVVPHTAAEIRAACGDKTREDLEQGLATAPAYTIAGRVMAWRSFGKATFFDLRDRTGAVQAFLQPAGPDDLAPFEPAAFVDALLG